MRTPSKRYSLTVTLLAALLLASGCSGPKNTDLSSNTTRESTSFEQPTMEASGINSESTESTLSQGSQKADVTVRVEGSRKTRFSGLCTLGNKNTVITGQVPKQFNYDLNGNSISCRIQKQDSTDGSLRVILLAGDTTRSVQQTSSEHGTINLSYSSN